MQANLWWQWSVLLGIGRRRVVLVEHKTCDDCIQYLQIVLVVPWIYTYVKTYQIVHFQVCTNYTSKVKENKTSFKNGWECTWAIASALNWK